MQNKNNKRIWNYLPYLIVLVAIFSLFSLNQPAASQNLSYDQLMDVLESKKVEESVLSIGSNVVTVKGSYKDGEKSVNFNAVVPATDSSVERLLDSLDHTELTIMDSEASNAFRDLMFSLIPETIVSAFLLHFAMACSGMKPKSTVPQ